MTLDEYEQLPPEGKEHFAECEECREIFDRRSCCYEQMRTKIIALLLSVLSAAFSACNRPSDNGELQRLREEVERLKSAQASASPFPTPAAE